MLGKRAKIVSPATLRRMLAYARKTRQPKRDAVIVLLSVKAGLRACEIAGLQWSMVMADDGKISDVVDLRNAIAKRGSGRRLFFFFFFPPKSCGVYERQTTILSRRTEAAQCAPTLRGSMT